MKERLYAGCLSLLLMLLAACGNADGSGNESSAPAAEAVQYIDYPSLPIAKMQALADSVDYIDFVFYYANFSMNQSDPASIKATLAQVSDEVPRVDPACQPIGSLFMQAQGREMMQAELYFSGSCVFFVWMENGKRTYANKMTPAGYQFYQKVFNQAQSMN